MSVQLSVIYPPPRILPPFERVYREQHLPPMSHRTTTALLLGVARAAAACINSTPDMR
jgi:hypothetical protein